METSESPSGPGLLEPFEPVVTAPPVVAIVVTKNPGPWLEETLASLAAQDYPSLSVLVLDNASGDDPDARASPRSCRTPTCGASTTTAGFPAAANEALEHGRGRHLPPVLPRRRRLRAGAVRVMVEEAYRSNAGIVGPKLVDYEHPDVLLEVGMAIDHYGVPFSAIEPNELDQEQHDAVRDVFFVSHAAMLVRADLFGELHGFDVATFPGSDDLDLCWRARLAGARVLVAPDARRAPPLCRRNARNGCTIGSPADGDAGGDPRPRPRADEVVLRRSRSSGCCRLAFLLNTVEAIGLLFGRQRGRARGLLERLVREPARARRRAPRAPRARRRCGASTTVTFAT